MGKKENLEPSLPDKNFEDWLKQFFKKYPLYRKGLEKELEDPKIKALLQLAYNAGFEEGIAEEKLEYELQNEDYELPMDDDE